MLSPGILITELSQRIETFLRDVYAGDEITLSAISEKRYHLTCSRKGAYIGMVMHELWDKIVSPGLEIYFDKIKAPMTEIPQEMPQEITRYDNKAKYTITYFQKEKHDFTTFLWESYFSDPIEFEMDVDRRGELPVIEEKRSLECAVNTKPQKPSNWSKEKLKKSPGDSISEVFLHVHSHYLLNVLRSVVQYSTGTDDYRNGIFQYPYKDLFGHRDEIEKYKTQSEGTRSRHSADYNTECDKHIDILLQYMDSLAIAPRRLPTRIWNEAKVVTRFTEIWLLLKPCADVYVQENGKLNAFVVDRVEGGVDYPVELGQPTKLSTYRVRVWNLHFDGQMIYRRSKWILVPHFDGEREITSLPLFPTQFHDDVNDFATRKKLIERGKRYFRYCKGPVFLQYTGPGLKEGWKNVSFPLIPRYPVTTC